MRYIIFSRVSTILQDTQNQLFEIDNYLNRIKSPSDEVIKFDEDVKSTRIEMEDRPVLNEMLDSLHRGDTVIVYKLSRLARGHELALVYHIITKKKKANLVSLYEKDLNDEIIHAYAMVGAFERKNIRDNTITALKKKQSCMEKVGTAWYGYKTDETKLQKREKVRSTNKPYLLIPDDKEQMQVTMMIKLRAQGFSYGEIAHELTKHGYTNRKGNPVRKSTIFRVMQRVNPSQGTPTLVTLG